MAQQQFLTFYINLPDKELVEQLQGTPGEGGAVGATIEAPWNPGPPPGGAAVAYGQQLRDRHPDTYPIPPYMPLKKDTDPMVSPSLSSAWFGSEYNFPTNVREFTRKTGGWFGIPFLFGTTVKFYWRGIFNYAPARASSDGTGEPGGELGQAVAPIPKRNWLDGAELPATGEGGTSTAGLDVSRESSRTVEGYGWCYRGWSNVFKQHIVNEYTGVSPSHDWERFYIRPRHFDSNQTVNIWRCTVSGLAGLMLDVTSTGQLAMFNRSSAGADTLISAFGQLVLDTWHKIDLLLHCNSGWGVSPSPDVAAVRVYIDGVLKATLSVGQGSGGFATNGATHLSSYLGNSRPQVNEAEFDFDDWMNAGTPLTRANLIVWPPDGGSFIAAGTYWNTAGSLVPEGNLTYRCTVGHIVDWDKPPASDPDRWVKVIDPIDWVNGSHMVLLHPTGFGANHETWTKDWRVLMNNPVTGAEVTSESSTATDRMELETDAELAVRAVDGAIGPVAMVVAKHGNRAGLDNGLLGWSINAVEDLDTIVESGAVQWNSRLWQPAGEIYEPLDTDEWTGVKLIHEKADNTSLATVWALNAVVECVGVFAQEDINVEEYPDLEGKVFVRHPHNAPYPQSPWVRSATPPLAPLMIVGGLYIGDDIGQDILLKLPVHFWIVRPLTGDQGGVKWWSSMLGAHRSYGLANRPQGMAQALLEFLTPAAEDEAEQQARLRVAGNQAQSNLSGVSYQYIGIADPWMRNVICGAFNHKTGSGPRDNPLPYPTFEPNAVWLMQEDVGTSTAVALWFKGPGHAADGAQQVATSESAGALSIEEGNLVSDDALYLAGASSLAYAAFRRNDGSGDPGAGRIVQIGSYVGNGSATRTIPLTPASGRYPLWAYLSSTAGAGYVRDPSHTTNTSSPIAGGTTVTTAIIAGGIDEITVGSSLNANGVTYNYFVVPGSEEDGGNGWSGNGEFWPVDPGTLPPGQGPWPSPPPGEEPTFPPEGPTEPPEPPTLPPELPPEISGDCLPYTQEVGNLALSQIGHGREVADLETETTEEAYAIRRYYLQDVKTTLRDFPWPFATRYSTLTLVSGSPTTPVNRDWTYAYRRPGDCIFERRLVVDRAGAVDPTPPPFQLSSDATVDAQGVHTGGGLILTNEANAQLEYTAWPTCPARFGDALFREACIWRLAASLAPSLSRIADRATYCEERYQATIAKAWQILRPGNPGPRPAAGSLDTAPAAAAANVAVVNRALVRIGARTIANLTTEQSREAVAAAVIFETELRSTLRDHPWAFATRYQDPLTLVAGAVDAPVNADWTFSYRLPPDGVFARRLVRPGTGRRFDPSPDQFRTTTDATGGLLFCDLEDPVLEYTARIDGAVLQSDALFQDAFAWRLAASLAPSLATVEPEAVEQRGRGPEPTLEQHPAPPTKQAGRATRERMAQYAWAMYRAKLLEAKVADAREQQPSRGGDDADWILARG